MRRGRRYRQRQCRHLNAWGIYGDGIMAMRYRRGFCPACGVMLDALPMKLRVTDETPDPCIPSPAGGLMRDDVHLAIVAKYRAGSVSKDPT